MTREPNKNPAASIRAKLLSLSREKGEDYQRVLGRFAECSAGSPLKDSSTG